MQMRETSPDAVRRRSRQLEVEFGFCRRGLAQGNTLAMQGDLDSANRLLCLVEDAAGEIKPILAGLPDRLASFGYKTQLAQVLKRLRDPRSELRIPEGLG